jgi:ABC-2 type transport system ATP-binding protein
VLAEVAQTVDRVLIINHGRLVIESPLAELTQRIAGSVLVRTPDSERLDAALHRAGVAATEREDGTVRVFGVAAERIGEVALQERIVLHQLVTESPSLEDVFLELTAEEAS